MLCCKIIQSRPDISEPINFAAKNLYSESYKARLCYTIDQLNLPGTLTVPGEPVAKSIAK